MTLKRRLLPIGIQTFAKIREDDAYYVDKTGFAMDMVKRGSHYFLARPRRFGKSLFIDTLKELFEGNAALFNGLAAETGWDWSKKFPVIRLSFGAGVVHSIAKLEDSLDGQFLYYEQRCGLQQQHLSLNRRFIHLIATLHGQHGQRVVVLVDEYDKPILDNIDDTPVALQLRESLKDIYSVIKDSDAHIRFAMLTGVSKFSKVSLFSGLNNLTDITLDPDYSAICGYTDFDVDSVFAPELPGLDREQIRQWYNGYNWLGEPVYNPFGLLKLFRARKIMPHWFETGTPGFLIKLLEQRQQFTPELGRIVTSETLLSTFDVDNIPVEALLFQTGYLTIADHWEAPGELEITLKYPNLEVQASLNKSLLHSLTGGMAVPVSRLYKLLQARDFVGLKTLFQAFYARIAND